MVGGVYLGRFQVGQTVPVSLLCVNRSGVPARPDAPPLIRIYRLYPTNVLWYKSQLAPIHDKAGAVSMFRLDLFLAANEFHAGRFACLAFYTAEGLDQVEEAHFEVVDGGNELGVVVGMQYWDRPEADYVVSLSEKGTLRAGRNPTVN